MSTTTAVRYLTPPQVAELLDTNRQKVVQWTATGELVAFNLARRSGTQKAALANLY
jgi:hypothetical protein